MFQKGTISSSAGEQSKTTKQRNTFPSICNMSLKTLPSRWWTGDHLAVIGGSRAAITTAAGVVLEESNACRCSLLLMSTRRQTGCTYNLHCSGIKYWCTHFLNASPGSAVPPPPPRNSRWREASDFRICSLRLLCTAHEKSLCIM